MQRRLIFISDHTKGEILWAENFPIAFCRKLCSELCRGGRAGGLTWGSPNLPNRPSLPLPTSIQQPHGQPIPHLWSVKGFVAPGKNQPRCKGRVLLTHLSAVCNFSVCGRVTGFQWGAVGHAFCSRQISPRFKPSKEETGAVGRPDMLCYLHMAAPCSGFYSSTKVAFSQVIPSTVQGSLAIVTTSWPWVIHGSMATVSLPLGHA
jgi:hypothetical protein